MNKLEREQKQNELISAYLSIAKNEGLKTVVDDVIDFCGLVDPSYLTRNLDNSNFNSLMSYREGQRSVAMFINDRIREANESISDS